MDKIVELKKNIHAEMVLEWWKLSGEYSMLITAAYVKNEVDIDTLAYLIAVYRRLLVELKEKVDDEFLLRKIREFEEFIFDPKIIIEKPKKLFELELLVRLLLERTGYTKYESYDAITK